jgi:hypothetical protein
MLEVDEDADKKGHLYEKQKSSRRYVTGPGPNFEIKEQKQPKSVYPARVESPKYQSSEISKTKKLFECHRPIPI